MTIATKDNSRLTLTPDQQAAHYDDLRWLAAPTLGQLADGDNRRLLIFPHCLGDHGDNIGAERIFRLHGDILETGNIMGFVGRGATKVRIHSRFAADDGRDYFMHYMLQRVFAVNLFELKYQSDSESLFDFLCYLLPALLKHALRQGLFRNYRSRCHNDANLRGRVDVSRHVRLNVPFSGSVAYTSCEYSHDNHVTQLVRHAIEHVARQPYARGLLAADDEARAAVAAIRDATPSYCRGDRQAVIRQNLRPLSHPFFGDYRPLQTLCLQILRHEQLKYGVADDEIYGILFDGAWLWEEYLNAFLHPLLNHPRNRTGQARCHLFAGNGGVCYPDFYNDAMVLDAKYKGYVGWNVQRTDLYQVISYMHVLHLQQGGFIVPVAARVPSRRLNGYGGSLAVYGLDVCHQCDSYKAFCDAMRDQEHKLYQRIASGM